MDSPDILGSCISNSQEINDERNSSLGCKTNNDEELEEQVMTNFKKINVPNVNVPEKIIICLDLCFDDQNSLYRLGDGTTYTPINMLKRVLDFFIHSKHAINKRTEFALLTLKNEEACFLHNFTNSIRDIINAIDYVNSEESTNDHFDFNKIFEILQQDVIWDLPLYQQSDCLQSPPYVVRMIVLYARSNCIPIINQELPILQHLKKHPYFYIDILFAHEDDCALCKCEDVYDALQDLDNGYSYVFEVSRNATKIHDCIAKLLAHPLQRPLQKNTDYTFPTYLGE